MQSLNLTGTGCDAFPAPVVGVPTPEIGVSPP